MTLRLDPITAFLVFLAAVVMANVAVRNHINHPCQHPMDVDTRAEIYHNEAPGLNERERFILATGLRECEE